MGWISLRPTPEMSNGCVWSAAVAMPLPAPAMRARRHLSLPPKAEVHKEYRCRSGRDSDLEAFSHNPSDGSFAPLAYQPST
uniref:Uncharacterized protein n=1 Tax=Magallana gigas TaxID=29159 RepID=K1P8R7_MAGGI